MLLARASRQKVYCSEMYHLCWILYFGLYQGLAVARGFPSLLCMGSAAPQLWGPSSPTRGQTLVSCTGGRLLTTGHQGSPVKRELLYSEDSMTKFWVWRFNANVTLRACFPFQTRSSLLLLSKWNHDFNNLASLRSFSSHTVTMSSSTVK